MAEETAVLYVRRHDAKAVKSRLENAALLDRRFRMAPAVAVVGGDARGDGGDDGDARDVCGVATEGAPSGENGKGGGRAAGSLDVNDCIAIPVLPECAEQLRRHRDGSDADKFDPMGENGDCGSLEAEYWSWLKGPEVVGWGRQVCPFSTFVLGNNNKRIHTRHPSGTAKNRSGAMPLASHHDGRGDDRNLALSNVQHALLETLNGWLENNKDAARDNVNESSSHERGEDGASIEEMVRELSVRTCPKKLEVMGDDRTLVVPRYSLFVASGEGDCTARADGAANNGGVAKMGEDEYRNLLAKIIHRSNRKCENASTFTSATDEIQSLLWKTLAKDNNSPRVVRRGDIDPESGVRESGHRILWPIPSPDDRIDGDCNRGFLPASTGPGSAGWITAREHGIRQSFDLSRVMFSRGNVTEKKRFGALVQPGERVLDMYAGIGHYTLPALIHGRASHVTACEWNPHALDALRHNLRANGVEGRATVLEGDCRVSLGKLNGGTDSAAESNQFDRISLGLLPSSEGGWAAAVACLRRSTGGWLHVHANVPTAERMDWSHWLVRSLANVAKEAKSNDWIAVCTHVQKVKSFAPKVDHVVADVFVGPGDSPKKHIENENSPTTGVVDSSGRFQSTPLDVPPPSCALDDGGVLHQNWMRECA